MFGRVENCRGFRIRVLGFRVNVLQVMVTFA